MKSRTLEKEDSWKGDGPADPEATSQIQLNRVAQPSNGYKQKRTTYQMTPPEAPPFYHLSSFIVFATINFNKVDNTNLVSNQLPLKKALNISTLIFRAKQKK